MMASSLFLHRFQNGFADPCPLAGYRNPSLVVHWHSEDLALHPQQVLLPESLTCAFTRVQQVWAEKCQH